MALVPRRAPALPENEKEPPRDGVALSVMVVRRRPTLPHSLPCSTIGAEGLSFRVRNGTGRFPLAMTAVTLWRYLVAGSPVRISGTAQWTHGNSVSVSSYRLISTGQLHGSLVPASTSGLSTQWSSWEPLGTYPMETSS